MDRDCREEPPFLPNDKFLFAYPLPWEFAGTFQSAPRPEITAIQIIGSAPAIGLGPTLAAGSAIVHLIEPGTM